MPFEGLDFFTFKIPQFDGFVPTSCHDRLAIGTEGYANDTIAMGEEPIFFLDSIDKSW